MSNNNCGESINNIEQTNNQKSKEQAPDLFDCPFEEKKLSSKGTFILIVIITAIVFCGALVGGMYLAQSFGIVHYVSNDTTGGVDMQNDLYDPHHTVIERDLNQSNLT